MRDNDMPACRCVSCDTTLDGATDPYGDAKPSPGDITICLYCGHIQAFGDDLRLRDLTDDEARDIAGDARVLQIQQARMKAKG